MRTNPSPAAESQDRGWHAHTPEEKKEPGLAWLPCTVLLWPTVLRLLRLSQAAG